MSLFAEAIKRRALRVRPTKAIEEHISKALSHYLRVQILWILNERMASASELAEELSAPLNRVSGHIKVLKKAGCIEVADSRVVGNTVQKFYRATARIFLDDTEWPSIPPTVQEGLRITLLQNLIDDAIEAVAHAIYDSVNDSHMSWTPMLVDEKGREEISQILARALKEVMAIQELAAKRLCEADEEGLSYSVSLLGYPSIGGLRKVNPARSAESGSGQDRGAAEKSKTKRSK